LATWDSVVRGSLEPRILRSARSISKNKNKIKGGEGRGGEGKEEKGREGKGSDQG
jgi:hypothetical protein